jgi:hypothetical protein
MGRGRAVTSHVANFAGKIATARFDDGSGLNLLFFRIRLEKSVTLASNVRNRIRLQQ